MPRITGLLACLTCLVLLPAAHAAETPAPAAPAESPARPPLPSRSELEASALERSLPAAELLRLPLEQGDFLALWRPAEQLPAKGVVILLPGDDEHADWPRAIGPLRRGLAAVGWNTLSLTLPDEPANPLLAPSPAAASGTPPDTPDQAPAESTAVEAYGSAFEARVLAAVAHARQAQLKPVILLAHGNAAYWTARLLQNHADLAQGLLLVDARQPEVATSPLPALLASLKLATGDYFHADEDGQAAQQRRQANLSRRDYEQLELPDLADQVGEDQQLLRRVRGWLAKDA